MTGSAFIQFLSFVYPTLVGVDFEMLSGRGIFGTGREKGLECGYSALSHIAMLCFGTNQGHDEDRGAVACLAGSRATVVSLSVKCPVLLCTEYVIRTRTEYSVQVLVYIYPGLARTEEANRPLMIASGGETSAVDS